MAKKQRERSELEDLDNQLQEIELEKDQPSEAVSFNKCKNCQGNLTITPLGVKFLVTCDGCNFREMKK